MEDIKDVDYEQSKDFVKILKKKKKNREHHDF